MQAFRVNDVIDVNKNLKLKDSDGKNVTLIDGDRCKVLDVTRRFVKLRINDYYVLYFPPYALDPADFDLVG